MNRTKIARFDGETMKHAVWKVVNNDKSDQLPHLKIFYICGQIYMFKRR